MICHYINIVPHVVKNHKFWNSNAKNDFSTISTLNGPLRLFVKCFHFDVDEDLPFFHLNNCKDNRN